MTLPSSYFWEGFGSGAALFVVVYVIKRLACKRRTRVAVAPREFTTEYILTLVVRSDIPLVKSKMASHCSHASVVAYEKLLKQDPQAAKFWLSTGQTKVILAAESIHVLNRVDEVATDLKLISTFVCDERKFLVGPATVTVLAIGPGPEDVISRINEHLPIL